MSLTPECPICFEELIPPIYQCPNGHIACLNCLKQILICGICRAPLPKIPIRCLAAEQLPKTIAKLRLAISRERLVNYCDLLGLTDILDCKESIRRDQIVGHIKQHGLSGVNGCKAEVIQELKHFISPQNWFPVFFEAYDETFFLLSGIRKDCDHDSSLGVSWKCAIVGDDLAARNYCVQLRLTNNDKNLKYLFNCSVFGIENHGHAKKDSQVLVPLSQLKQFGKYNWTNKLEWTITVQIGKKSENENGFLKINRTVVPKVLTYSPFRVAGEIPNSLHTVQIQANSKWTFMKVVMDLAYENQLLIAKLIIEILGWPSLW